MAFYQGELTGGLTDHVSVRASDSCEEFSIILILILPIAEATRQPT